MVKVQGVRVGAAAVALTYYVEPIFIVLIFIVLVLILVLGVSMRARLQPPPPQRSPLPAESMDRFTQPIIENEPIAPESDDPKAKKQKKKPTLKHMLEDVEAQTPAAPLRSSNSQIREPSKLGNYSVLDELGHCQPAGGQELENPAPAPASAPGPSPEPKSSSKKGKKKKRKKEEPKEPVKAFDFGPYGSVADKDKSKAGDTAAAPDNDHSGDETGQKGTTDETGEKGPAAAPTTTPANSPAVPAAKSDDDKEGGGSVYLDIKPPARNF